MDDVNEDTNSADKMQQIGEKEKSPKQEIVKRGKGRKKTGSEKKEIKEDVHDGEKENVNDGTFVCKEKDLNEDNNNKDIAKNAQTTSGNVESENEPEAEIKQNRRRTFVQEIPTVSLPIQDISGQPITTGETLETSVDNEMEWSIDTTFDASNSNARTRLYSKSDFAFDVRPYLINKSFMLCGCEYSEPEETFAPCDCNAEISFDSSHCGTVTGVFFNPISNNLPEENVDDLMPPFKSTKTSWNSDRPNKLNLTFRKVKNRQITSVKGKINITGERGIEVEKGRKLRCMYFTVEMTFGVNGSKAFLKILKDRFTDEAAKNPIMFKSIKFDMISAAQIGIGEKDESSILCKPGAAQNGEDTEEDRDDTMQNEEDTVDEDGDNTMEEANSAEDDIAEEHQDTADEDDLKNTSDNNTMTNMNADSSDDDNI